VSDKRELLTFEQAVAMLPDGEWIHTFSNAAGFVLVGADWSREDVIEAIRTKGAEKSGPMATGTNHGICLVGERLFIETRSNPAPAKPVDTETDTRT
jgi:hypothetical protein